MRTFGCLAYAFIPKQKRMKLEPRREKCIMIGYSSESKGYILLNIEKGNIFTNDDVKFNESVFPEVSESETYEIQDPDFHGEDEDKYDKLEERSINIDHSDDDESMKEFVASNTEDESRSEAVIERPKRRRIPRDHGPFINEYDNFVNISVGSNQSIESILNGDNGKHWKEAIRKELESLITNNTFIIVEREPERNTIQNKFVFAEKKNSEGVVERLKARLVAKGFSQKHGIDYHETFSPVVLSSTTKLMFALAAKFKVCSESVDIDNAFMLPRVTNEELYMELPPLFSE
jgi:hypothetical protein